MNRSTPSSLGSINPAKAAFTLIEIVLVIAIIAILGAAAINLIKGNVDVAKETRVESDIKNIVTVEPIPERWTQLLEEVPKDPWNREFRYEYPAKRSKADFDVYSLGKDGVDSEDDFGNWKPVKKE
jgi:general secretion pathway protein G